MDETESSDDPLGEPPGWSRPEAPALHGGALRRKHLRPPRPFPSPGIEEEGPRG